MIVVDSSVWIAAAREPATELAETLRQLIDADEVSLALPVRLELMAGVARRDRSALKRALTALPVAFPSEETWHIVEGWIEPAAAAGQRFAVTDLLIAGLARELGGLVWSLDDDFVRMETLGFVQLYG